MIKKFWCLLFSLLFISGYMMAQVVINDWENPGKPFQNSMKSHAWFIPYNNEADALKKGSSPEVRSLDGIWKFKLVNTPAERPLDFYKKDFNVLGWSDIKVPASWQTEGFDRFIFTDVEYPIPPNPPFVPKDFNPVGSYKRSFKIDGNWKDKNVFIRLDGMNSFFYLWINENYVGFSKDSKTAAEFDITPFLIKGENTVSIQVFRFSDGTYLEGQDMWKLSGIERSVLLIARPKFSVYDFFVTATLDESYKNGVFDLKIKMNRIPQKEQLQQAVQIRILDEKDGNKVLFNEKKTMTGSGEFSLYKVFSNIKTWNAENPNLYTLVINQLGKDGKVIESISQKIGFRNAEIKHGLFLINGVAIKFKGVNRHEHNMITGKVVSREDMIHDIRIFKEYNINAVRSSHYPNAAEWYDLCDEYGMYVVDEANIECDGMSFSPLKTLSDKSEWAAAYLDRVNRMFQTNKNNSSIIMWSLGNESEFGQNFIDTYQYLKGEDSTRPVVYEPASRTQYSDVFFPMYKSLNIMQEYVKEWRNKPFIQCEYAHMMGNGGGNLKDYWDLIYKYEQLQGGFIWDFSDQTFLKKDKNNRQIWGYGSDMGNVGVTSDTSYCADGLFTADRQPHPQAFELKKVYQNIDFKPMDFTSNTVTVINRYDFTNLNQFNFDWFVKADGKIVAQGKLNPFDLAPHQTKNIKIDIPDFKAEPGTEYFLSVNATTKYATELVPADFLLATDQFKLPVYKEKEAASLKGFPALDLVQDANKISISTASFSVSFNKKTGWLDGYSFQQTKILKDALVPHFWRAATDNDIGNSQQMRCAVWQDPLKTGRLDSIKVMRKNAQQYEVKTQHYLPDVKAGYLVIYLISSNGDVQVNAKMIASNADLPEMPRFGMKVVLNKEFDQVKWLGRGPFDNYSDRKDAADIDVYAMEADSLFYPYARAQESGYRTDVRWMSLLNKNGVGLMAVGAPTISTGVLHFDMKNLDFNREIPENNHGGSIINEDLIWWNIDYKQMGVGGDNSWGAKPHAEYLLPFRNYEYSFTLRPVSGSDSVVERGKE